MIPILYGTDRLSGQVVWQADPVAHNSGGKGGPKAQFYSCSFAVKFCKGPKGGVLRLWANSTLVYDVTPGSNFAGTVAFTTYLGVESALPDPTMEGVVGVGDIPAFRDDVVLVFTNLDLTNYGNALPSLSAEIYSIGGVIPVRISTFDTHPDTGTPDSAGQYGATYDGTNITSSKFFYYSDGHTYYEEATFLIDGTVVTPPASTMLDAIPGGISPGQNLWGVVSNLNVGYCTVNTSSGIPIGAFYNKNILGTIVANPVNTDPAGPLYTMMVNSVYMNNFIYTISGSGSAGITPHLVQWASPSGIAPSSAGLTVPIPSGASDDMRLAVCWETNKIYVMDTAATSGDQMMWQYDSMLLNLDHTWMFGDLPLVVTTAARAAQPFIVYNDILCINLVVTGSQHAYAYQINGDYSLTLRGNILQDNTGSNDTFGEIRLGGGYVISDDGVISLDAPASPVTLASIVTDISVARCGLTTGQIDVTQLTQLVDGYIISNQATGRDAILPLQSCYFFDGVESAAVMKFVMRGAYPTLTIPDTDLAAQEPKATPPPLATIVRTQEVDLPAVVNVSYPDVDVSYQQSSQQARRQVTSSLAVSSITVAVVMNALTARRAAFVLLFGAWIEREALTLLLPLKYGYLEPTDVIMARGYTLRVVSKSQIAVGIIQLDCVISLPSLYTVVQSSNSTQGGQQTTPTLPQASQLLLLDIPLILDTDPSTDIYAAMSGAANAASWRGADLYKSADGGTTYVDDANTNVPAVMGITSSALPTFGGGNQFDQINAVTVVIGIGGGELESASELSVLNGANDALIGSELVQFENADLVSANTYTLSGLLRGRRGTEWAMGTHIVGEPFVLMPVLDVPLLVAELGQSRMYKPVSSGTAIATTVPQTFTDMGARIKPYSPVGLGGGVINGSGDVALDWTRRTRVGGAWLDFVDVPLSEGTEAYVVQIWDATYTLCARIIMVGATQTTTYTGAQQTTDFGGTQAQIYFSVGQVGAFTLGAQAFGIAQGSGGSNNAPTSPIAPYIYIPNIPPPGPTAPVDIAMTWPQFDSTFPMLIGQRKVASFTTGVTIPLTGTIEVFEYTSTSTPRHCFIANDTGGLSIVPKSVSYGTTATSFIGAAADGAILAANTTYYFIFDFVQPDGSLSGPPGFNAYTGLNLGNVT
jgi:hypothetical protein